MSWKRVKDISERSTGGLPSTIHAASASPTVGEIERPATLQPLAKWKPKNSSFWILARKEGLKRQLQGAGRPPPSLCEHQVRNIVDATVPSPPPGLRRRRGIPVNKKSKKRAPEPMTARGDSLGCSRNPGSNLYAGLFAPSLYTTSVPTARRKSNAVSFAAGRQCRWQLVWNVGTWPAMPREKAQAAPTARPKVPMRRRGADCLVVVTKRGNARGAKGAGHRR